MRSLKMLTLLTVLTSLCGCSETMPPVATNSFAIKD